MIHYSLNQGSQVKTIHDCSTRLKTRKEIELKKELTIKDLGTNCRKYNSINDLFNFIAEGSYINKERKKQRKRKGVYFGNIKPGFYYWNVNLNQITQTTLLPQIISSSDDFSVFKTELELHSFKNGSTIDKIKPIITNQWLNEINKLSSHLSNKIKGI